MKFVSLPLKVLNEPHFKNHDAKFEEDEMHAVLHRTPKDDEKNLDEI